ncbi:MAG: IS21 family transposase [Clostridium sp.]|nr:IS21 family transposase [Clostridium sp.]
MQLEKEKYTKIHELIIDGYSYREISNEMDISKNTPGALIKRFRNTGSIYPSINRASIYDPIINELRERISLYLLTRRRTYNSWKKQKLSSDEIYELIKADGYQVSKTKFKELLRYEKNSLKESYLNIIHLPGEKVQFDWGKITLTINGTDKRLFIAVFTLPFSNYRKAYVYENENGYSFTKAFKEFIKDMDGVPPILLTDNMKIARIINRKNHKEKILTKLFSDLSRHYGFEVEFCNPRCPNEKGSVENGVKVIKSEILSSHLNSCNTIEELNTFISDTCERLNNDKHYRKNDTCTNLMKHEMKCFKPLPKSPYIYYEESTRIVSNKGEISFKNNKYGVPSYLKGEKVNIRYNKTLIYIISKDNKIISKYNLSDKKHNRYHRIWYSIRKLLEKPDGFIHSEEYSDLPKWMKIIFQNACQGNPITFGNLLYKLHGKPKDLISKLARRKNTSIYLLKIEQIYVMLE